MTREYRQYCISAKNEAAKYRRELKEYKTKDEKRAFKLAYDLRMKDMEKKASKLENSERKLTEKAIRCLRVRISLINFLNG